MLLLIHRFTFSGLFTSLDTVPIHTTMNNLPTLPHSPHNYHGKTTVINHKKKVRHTKETINQQLSFKINIQDGALQLLLQKDGQGRVLMKKESQIKSITSDVLQKLMKFMGFADSVFKNKLKKELVEWVCHIFAIPTTDAMIITIEDAAKIVQYMIDFIEEHEVVYELIDYIHNNQENMSIIAEIIEQIECESINIFEYLQIIWILLIDNFEINKDDDFEYKKMFKYILQTNAEIKQIRNKLQQEINEILNQYNAEKNKNVTMHLFWYSFNLLVLKFFNSTIKNYVLSTSVIEPISSPMNEQRKCSIYKYFGSAFNSQEKLYEGQNYGTQKSEDLLLIVWKCLLSYDTNDFEQGQNNNNCNNNNSNEYFKAPLRLRLQNRGKLKIINNPFYNNVAIKIYEKIVQDVRRVFICYDPKEVKRIETKIMNDESIYNAFDKHVGAIMVADEEQYKHKVLKDLAHGVTSRIVTSMVKRNKIKDIHVGQFRTGIKALQSKR
eukprot:218221_1